MTDQQKESNKFDEKVNKEFKALLNTPGREAEAFVYLYENISYLKNFVPKDKFTIANSTEAHIKTKPTTVPKGISIAGQNSVSFSTIGIGPNLIEELKNDKYTYVFAAHILLHEFIHVKVQNGLDGYKPEHSGETTAYRDAFSLRCNLPELNKLNKIGISLIFSVHISYALLAIKSKSKKRTPGHISEEIRLYDNG